MRLFEQDDDLLTLWSPCACLIVRTWISAFCRTALRTSRSASRRSSGQWGYHHALLDWLPCFKRRQQTSAAFGVAHSSVYRSFAKALAVRSLPGPADLELCRLLCSSTCARREHAMSAGSSKAALTPNIEKPHIPLSGPRESRKTPEKTRQTTFSVTRSARGLVFCHLGVGTTCFDAGSCRSIRWALPPDAEIYR